MLIQYAGSGVRTVFFPHGAFFCLRNFDFLKESVADA